ncbi:hypothetical protein DICVIV_09038 [Dictyocaulus viviparus]|uniref:Uncharacterized protein n=1 Tax=Dictyocaulus viviparus TaxID=29172 RepID=A0A0D8XJZ9_DICVI|nr:hypothetical protein DICVIV_09038 [Dictyocaulus viviparus]
MLQALHARAVPDGYSRVLLLRKFLQRRVEIFSTTSNSLDLDSQILAIFGDPGIDELVAQMPLRCSLKTIEIVFNKLLSSFNAKYNPQVVCTFFALNIIREFCRAWTAQQWACLARYVVEMVVREPRHVKSAVNLIDNLVDLTSVEITVPITEVVIAFTRSDLPLSQRKQAQSLLDVIHLRYPCLFVDPLANQASIQGFRWRQKDTDGLLTTLVSYAVNPTHSEPFCAVRMLTQVLEKYPRAVIR